MSNIYIGVGHGGIDSGAVGNGLKESDVALDIALSCRDYLLSAKQTVTISRTTDVYMSVAEKSAQANSLTRDCVLDIHCNAGGGKGFEVFYQNKSAKAHDLAEAIETSVTNEIGLKSRGCKTNLLASGQDYFHMLREVKAPSVLVECAFIDNNEDATKFLWTHAKRQLFGIAIGKGILNYLGKSLPVTTPTEGKKTMYIVQAGAFSTKEAAETYAKQLTKYGIKTIIKQMEG